MFENVRGRFALKGGPAPVMRQVVVIDGDYYTVLFVGSSWASLDGLTNWACVISYPGCLSEPWVDQVQGSPPEFQDRRTPAQKSTDEAARLKTLAASPLGGSYRLSVSVFGYPNFATYMGPAPVA